jgi:hypothetical protein
MASQKTITITLATLVVALLAVFVWPTAYRYDRTNFVGVSNVLVRTNRFTGNSQSLTPNGWHDMKPAAPDFIPDKP